MAMTIGDNVASEGLSKDIFDVVKIEIIDELDLSNLPEADQEPTRTKIEDQMKKFCFAISKGVINHFKDNAEIKNVETTLDTANNINTRIKDVVTLGVPVALDGGVALKSTMLVPASIPSVDNTTQNNSGTIE